MSQSQALTQLKRGFVLLSESHSWVMKNRILLIRPWIYGSYRYLINMYNVAGETEITHNFVSCNARFRAVRRMSHNKRLAKIYFQGLSHSYQCKPDLGFFHNPCQIQVFIIIDFWTSILPTSIIPKLCGVNQIWSAFTHSVCNNQEPGLQTRSPGVC